MQITLPPNQINQVSLAEAGLQRALPVSRLTPFLAGSALVILANTGLEWLKVVLMPLLGQRGTQLLDIMLTSAVAITGISYAVRKQTVAYQRTLTEITERERVEAALTRLSHRYELILNAVGKAFMALMCRTPSSFKTLLP